jgi:hypothetical protein
MKTRHAIPSLGLVAVLLLGPVTIDATGPNSSGFLPAKAKVHGLSLVDIATAYTLWGFGTSADVNPLIASRCERSPIDPNIWFLPVSVGGDAVATCSVPPGAFLVATPGFIECSNIEPPPFFGTNLNELKDCVDGWFEQLNYAEVILDGTPVANLDTYALTARPVRLPANNLNSADPGVSLSKGYFLVIPPLSRGTHTLRLYDEFLALGFKAGLTITIVAG